MNDVLLTTRARIGVLAGLAALPAHAGFAMQTPYADATPHASPVAAGDFRAMAEDMWTRVNALYLMPDDDNLYREFAPHLPSARRFAFLWPFSSVLSGAVARALLEQSSRETDDMSTVFETLEQYFDADTEPLGYDSYPVWHGGGDKFYDDNEWLGIEFAHAYTLTNSSSYLEKARLTFDFAISGWTDEDMGGGIYWQQHVTASKNTCSNGPAAVLALLLYQITEEPDYLDWAVKIMTWLNGTLYDSTTGVYNDNISADGAIEPTKWSYNAGTPLQASALLYKATGEQEWLDKARTLAADSLTYFGGNVDEHGVRTFPATPWFNAILHRGYCALYDVDPDADRTYIDAIPESLARAWSTNLDAQGLLDPDWSLTEPTEAPRALIDQASIIEICATAAKYEQAQHEQRDARV